MSVMDEVIFVLQLAEAATESLSVPALTNVVKLSLKLAERGKVSLDVPYDRTLNRLMVCI